MKTLVIHPYDRTTEFLKIIYEGKGYTVCTSWKMSGSEFLKMVRKHDRIIMMGHGSPHGLIGFSHIFMNTRVIKLLKKKDCVCIWCNADKYVIPNGIRGFYTGMFISEVSEADYYNIPTTQENVTYSNNLFANLMKDMIESPNILSEIKSSYIGNCPVISFNNQRLYYRNGKELVLEDQEKITSK